MTTVSAALACTVVYTPTPPEARKAAAVVFSGIVLRSDLLPPHPEMRGRQRYAVTLKVTRYWKGERGATVALYDISPGTDCLGAGLSVGKEYLIFAKEEGAREVRYAADDFVYGWTDILAPGTAMLMPQMNTPGGDLTKPQVRKWLRQLGRGREPSR
jgi:hypothetical protein